ncbi:M48 family metalloprotease [Microbulbifer thermotolerans]|uniref:Putative beta-barrel assembly-enhancing protease n=1 Tax=Microbulbifer thermotolerans TaxID=252514 RepID=A0AB35HY25_MICTH|nr:M48 family metalloprotease [Microbulbifer thermotolerans]MCX2801348.1 M48 family metalloprotease [Microbulbifer thermotolerans]WKT61264.1 M48 family metalloprotease [Microbulbifer thermotolerans]
MIDIHTVNRRPLRQRFSNGLAALGMGLLLGGTPLAAATDDEIRLPELGDSSSALVSRAREKELGQMWLRMFRSQVRTSNDALLQQYVERTLKNLAEYAPLEDKSLDVVVVLNDTMNAFAVPGGVVGVHTGLFLFAENEDQFASVLAHELAHLSQRHYARSLEAQRNSTIPTLAGMLGALVLAATAGGDAGIAAMTATQAAALDNQLRFSRKNEQEADRIGIETLAKAGMDPEAAGEMFEQMLKATRYYQRPPEFLLTHPVTEKRIADAKLRASRMPDVTPRNGRDYHLMRARIRVAAEATPQQAVKRFQAELNGINDNEDAARYGLALAQIAAGKPDSALDTLQPLLDKEPNKDAFVLARADIDLARQDYASATSRLQRALNKNPGDHALIMGLANAHFKAGNYLAAERILAKHSRVRRKDPAVWYLLAETHGLAGDIVGVHEARAEYYILNGVFDKALQHLRHGIRLAKNDYQTHAILEQRIKDVIKMQEKAKEL